KLGTAVVVLAAVNDGKIALVAGVTKDLTDKYQAGKILNQVATQVGGKGGGGAKFAPGVEHTGKQCGGGNQRDIGKYHPQNIGGERRFFQPGGKNGDNLPGKNKRRRA
ncbi:MAG: hypothetical protein HAW59_03560, partial [Betaproteobacteria bacterium]|nr:hypothetical protein [Betaproteobacteria bacterium]